MEERKKRYEGYYKSLKKYPNNNTPFYLKGRYNEIKRHIQKSIDES
jgi:hypothetical protein